MKPAVDIMAVLAERHSDPFFAEELLQTTTDFQELPPEEKLLSILDGIHGILHFLYIAAEDSGAEGTDIVVATGHVDKAKAILLKVAGDVLSRQALKSSHET